MDYNDLPDEEWVEDQGDEEDVYLACPACHRLIHEDTQQCPYCGDWIIPVDPAGASKRWIAAVIVLLLVTALVLLTVT